ncbi:acetyltransferase, putative [Bodo saltans]|uniref:tRNA carboxymethyluridine synthase n=1 Tax=Bodo saltans TaxID=75058 RepID=A0A0S4IQT9_BODSA|nr:acetyltransferase, putative [Bodo saltans]|eukprot:CUF33771.1 acetyltransferase, putative [Bodo saltans]
MPDAFTDLLGCGGRDVPEEAKDIEEAINGHLDWEDLPKSRRDGILRSVKTLCERSIRAAKRAVEKNEPTHVTEKELEKFVVQSSRISGIGDTAKKSELTAAYRQLVRQGDVATNPIIEQLLIRKKGRSHSGVLVITVFLGPGEFSCPKDCHYCPNQPGVARSYLLKEPGVLRGYRNQWDPIRQFVDRACALENNGHVVDKIELIILGGTFSFYPVEYVEQFMQASFYAANTYFDSAPLRPSGTLAEELHINETARCRIIGVTVETRPDFINASELRRYRSLGVTRVQLGIQHLDDDILNLINRDCPTAKTVVAIKRLLDGGFKVDAHWMPDLPGSSYQKDMELFQNLFSEENVNFQVDQWKVYPTATVPFTVIKQWYEEGRYKPYAEEEGGKYMVQLLVYIMKTCPERIRLNRIIRDIPGTYIMGGEKRGNLRQVIEAAMKADGIRCKDIRERECKGAPIDRSKAKVFVDKFRASEGTEYYISIENESRSSLFGHLRLRIRDDCSLSSSLFPALENAALIRELHTYGRLVAVNTANTGKEAQHMGVGTELMRKAESIALTEHGLKKTVVIAGIGVRKYYEKLGYHLQDTYMVKSLATDVPITEELVLADNDNDSEATNSLLNTFSGAVQAVASAASRLLGWAGSSKA